MVHLFINGHGGALGRRIDGEIVVEPAPMSFLMLPMAHPLDAMVDGAHVAVHLKKRTVTVGDGRTRCSASFLELGPLT